MTTASFNRSALPDPMFRPEFYADTATKRLIAWVVDTVIIMLLCAVIIPFTAFTALFFLPILFVCVSFVYRTVTLSNRSATWGMRFMALEFRDLQGARMSPGLAFAHSTGYTISTAMIFPQIASIILMLVTPRGQGLSDLVLGTAAMNRATAY